MTRTYRYLALVGEDRDVARRGEKRLIAVSRCRFDCDDDERLDRCVAAIRRSDEHLRNRPEEMMLWDWQSTYVEVNPDDGTSCVLLGVAWYDKGFYDAKRDAYMDGLHARLYDAIGIQLDSITVSHWLYAGDPGAEQVGW
jgi:hypothetical protein